MRVLHYYLVLILSLSPQANTVLYDADGFLWTTQTDINFFWNNHGDDTRCNDMWDGVDATTVFQDYEVTTGDPKFTTPGSDHSLQDTSPNIDAGMSIILGV